MPLFPVGSKSETSSEYPEAVEPNAAFRGWWHGDS